MQCNQVLQAPGH